MKWDNPTVVYEDNAACRKMIENPVVSLRNKHIEIDAHFIREQYELGSITITAISTEDQIADLFTKNLPRTIFEKHVSNVMNE